MKDNQEYYTKAFSLLKKITSGQSKGIIPTLIISELVYILTSKKRYNLNRRITTKLILHFFSLNNIIIEQKEIMVRSLLLFTQHTKLDFPDCYLLAKKHLGKIDGILTFDKELESLS